MGECDREGGKRKGGKRKEGKRKGGQAGGGQGRGAWEGVGYLLRAARSSFPTSMRRLRSLRKRVTYREGGEIERGGEG